MDYSLYFECFSGVSGDMILASLIDLGADISNIEAQVKKVASGFKLKSKRVFRNEIKAAKLEIIRTKRHDLHSAAKISRLISASRLDPDIKKSALQIFTRLAQAEAQVHGVKIENAHFEELSDIDTLIDIVGSLAAMKQLGIKDVYFSRISSGQGMIRTHHGIFPNPAPATVKLLKGCKISYLDIDKELVTPTGAAIITSIGTQSIGLESAKIYKTGYGAGTLILKDTPNLLRATLIEQDDEYLSDYISVIETNIDDMSPNMFELLCERLYNAGALDVYITPIQMKKFRPAFLLTVLSDKKNLMAITGVIFDNSTTFGVRHYQTQRLKLDRKFSYIKTKFGPLKVKTGFIGNKVKKIIPEYDCVKTIAKKYNAPLSSIYKEAAKHEKI